MTASSGFFSFLDPIYTGFGWLLAQFYTLVPNYAFAIIMLTIVVMGVLTPLTVKSTKSMVAMQQIQPEIKKLQQKYKGPENRQLLNDELVRLYKESGTNPFSSCLPVLAQAPFLFILYNVIRGLTNVNALGVVSPKYIPHSSTMFQHLVASQGKISTFGMDLALKPFSHHSSFLASVPFFAMVALAVGLQYFQMAQINNRNKKTGQEIPSQQQRIQKLFPILFAYFYFIIPAAVTLYMVVSSAIRILTQDILFRVGMSDPRRTAEREIPARTQEESKKQKSQPQTLKSQANNRSKTKRKRKDR